MSRTCTKCNLPETPDRPFKPRENCCKECKKQYLKQYRQNEDVRAREKLNYAEWRAKNSDKTKLSHVKDLYYLRLSVLSYYSGGTLQCALCPESRLAALQVDHIYGGGKKHKAQLGGADGTLFFRWLKQNNFPDGYRILCANCNIREYLKSRILSIAPKAILQRKYRRRIKLKMMSALGGICKCGCVDLDVLTIHHINNDGKVHRDRVGKGSSTSFYKSILRSNDFTGLECMCFSCNDALESNYLIDFPRLSSHHVEC